MFMRTIYLFIIGILLMACEQPQQESDTQAAAHCLEAAEVALAKNQGDRFLILCYNGAHTTYTPYKLRYKIVHLHEDTT